MKRIILILGCAIPLIALAASGFAPNRRLWFQPVSSGGASLPTPTAYWNMDAASGNETDQTGNGRNLTDNNTVGSEAGLLNGARLCVSNNLEYLSATDAAWNSAVTNSFTFVTYWKPTWTNATQAIAGKWTDSAPNREWQVFGSGVAGRVDLTTVTNGGSSFITTRSTNVFCKIGEWNQVAVIFDNSIKQLYLVVNATNWWTNLNFQPGFVTNGAGLFQIGRRSSSGNFYGDSSFDETLWHLGTVWTRDQIEALDARIRGGQGYPW